jgi:hypothetical protein
MFFAICRSCYRPANENEGPSQSFARCKLLPHSDTKQDGPSKKRLMCKRLFGCSVPSPSPDNWRAIDFAVALSKHPARIGMARPRISSRVLQCVRREPQGLLAKVCVPFLKLSVGCRIHRVKHDRLFVPVSLPTPRVPSSHFDMQSSVLLWLGKETSRSFRGSIPLRKSPRLCTIAQQSKSGEHYV